MKAQHVKNTVIVPVGAKGGFVVRRLTAGDREAQQVRGDRVLSDPDSRVCSISRTTSSTRRSCRRRGSCATTAMMRISSSRRTREPPPSRTSPTRFRRNTASGSGDAFASGGSAGYDHKKMAITARGAWECVKRHFREIGVDIQSQDFTVAGIGDMAGDVFGNGMLQSPHIRLIAAFNHQHIFIDPQPDAARSFRERAAAVPPAALLLGGLLEARDLKGRRRLLARRQEPDLVARGAEPARAARAGHARTKSSRPYSNPTSICSGTAASAPTSRRAAKATATSATAATMRCASTPPI